MTDHREAAPSTRSFRGRVAGGAQGAPGEGEGAHAPARRAGPPAARAAVGEGREGLRLRHARTARRRSPTCSPGAASSSSTTSCSARTGRRGARAARSSADHLDGAVPHLARGTCRSWWSPARRWPKIEAFKKRMGWRFPWVSSFGSDFNFDFHVSFTPEQLADGKVVLQLHRRASSRATKSRHERVLQGRERRHLPHLLGVRPRPRSAASARTRCLDLVPKGRDEDGLPSSMAWVRHHDRYGTGYASSTRPAVLAARSPKSGGGLPDCVARRPQS